MPAPETLARRHPDPAGLDFDGLRAAGISLLQELCGDTWTDHNLHDPGITILEQLCYALTELGYRAGFPVADLLTGPDGRIDYDRQALYPPADILPSQPLTVDDYRRFIVDRVPEVENAWLRTRREPDAAGNGLYWIHLRLRDTPFASERPDPVAVLRKVRDLFAAHRNLCEDLQAVRIATQRRHTLKGRIELDGTRPPAETLAHIYLRSARLMGRGLDITPHAELLDRGLDQEALFDGPLTPRGRVDSEQLSLSRDTMTLVDLIGLVGSLPGVRHVDHLLLLDEKGQTVDGVQVDSYLEAAPCLAYPASEKDMGLQLYKDGRPYQVSHQTLMQELGRLAAEPAAARRGEGSAPADLFPSPAGSHRDLERYFSIQHQFPDLYGINARGMPDSASPARRAQARQLKAYLLLFEQILANGFAGLAQVRRLYALDGGLEQTYFSQVLDNDLVPDADCLYRHTGGELAHRVAGALATLDDFGDRRNRVLDYLLGLHGETFSQKSLRQFNAYQTEEDTDAILIQNKLRLLSALPELSRRRPGADNTLKPDGAGAALLHKLSVLLDMPHGLEGPACDPLRGWGLALAAPAGGEASAGSGTPFREHLLCLPEAPRDGDEVPVERLFDRLPGLGTGVLDSSLLRHGIAPTNYCFSPGPGEGQLLFRAGPEATWQDLAPAGDLEDAASLATGLRAFLLRMNRESERLALVEHILLRPRTDDPKMDPSDFHAFRLSVIFPAWTARCADPSFRHLAEETVALNCPAHIMARVHWLDFEAMSRFEALHDPWLAALAFPQADLRGLDAASARLAGFLQSLEENG